jgi:hypothetical protein
VEFLLHPGGTGEEHLKVVHRRMVRGKRRNVNTGADE